MLVSTIQKGIKCMGAKYVQNFTGKSLKSLTSSSEILGVYN